MKRPVIYLLLVLFLLFSFSAQSALDRSIIVGFDDSGSVNDDNHDDLIDAFSQVPVPLPVLLMGLGLIGFIGIRRRYIS